MLSEDAQLFRQLEFGSVEAEFARRLLSLDAHGLRVDGLGRHW
jgi:hypothetical protein